MKHRLPVLSFPARLFFAVSITIVILISILGSFFYFYMFNTIVENQLSTCRQLNQNVLRNLNLLLYQMNVASTSVVNNTTVNDIIFQLNFGNPSPTEYRYLESALKVEMTSAFFNLPGTSNISIYNLEKEYYIYTGVVNNETEYMKKRMQDVEWYQQALHGNPYYVVPPGQDFWKSTDSPVLCLRRGFSTFCDSYSAIFEIQVPYAYLEELCSLEQGRDNNAVLLFDKEGNLLYPLNPDESFLKTYSPELVFKSFSQTGTGSRQLKNGTSTLLMDIQHLDSWDWYAATVSCPSSLNREMGYYALLSIIIWLGICLVILTTFYLLIRRLTRPLVQLAEQIKTVHIGNLHFQPSADYHDELGLLVNAFSGMLNELQSSIDTVYASRVRENEARLMALQAQIDPHFIFNTLHSISSVCENNDDALASRMCICLADLLRYTTNQRNDAATLADELQNARDYLTLMSIPYSGMFHFLIDSQAEAEKQLVPRLLLQPILENCFAHAFSNKLPPWEIEIQCYIQQDAWRLSVRDNGSGFTQEKIQELMETIQTYKDSSSAHNIQMNMTFGGMGLLNVFSRLYLAQKQNAFFQITSDETGTVICLGGKREE